MADSPAAPWLAANLDALAAALGTPIDVGGDGHWVVTTAADGAVLNLKTAGGTLLAAHSRRQPAAEAARLVDDALGGRACPPVAMVIGAGLGATVETLLGRDASVRVLIIEPDPSGAAALLGHRDWTDAIAGGRLLVLIGPDFRGAEGAWRFVPVSDTAPVVVVHPVLAREYPEDVRRAAAVGTRVLGDARANAGAEAALAGPYLLNTIENLGVVAHEGDVDALAGAFDGVPAIVVAAGPSLDSVIADVSRLADRALVIAVDTALRPLLTQGVVPHLAVAVDPSERNARHLTDLEGADSTWLVAEPSVHPLVFPSFAGRTFVFRVGDNHPWPWLASLGVRRGTLAAWGSVLVSALDLAIRVGARPIAIVGADLAYSGGQPYCRGTAFEEDWAREVRYGSTLAEVWARVAGRPGAQERDDLHGRPVPTLPHLVAFRERLLDQITASGVRIVNATGGGILHGRGIELAPLDALLGVAPRLDDLRARIGRRRSPSIAPRAIAGALATALARPGASQALAAMVAGVDGDRVSASVALARTAMARTARASLPTGPQLSPASSGTTDAPVWWPEQTAALGSLATVSPAARVPLAGTAVGVEPTLAAVVDAARDLLAHDPLTVGPIDDAVVAGNLLALPLPLMLPFADGARADAARFSAILTRWITATVADVLARDAPFWSTPPEPIDSPGDGRGVTRSADELARFAIMTTLAGAAGRLRRAEATVARVAAAVPQIWPRITGERATDCRVELSLTSRDTHLHWIREAPLAPLARALTGTVVPTAPASDVGQPIGDRSTATAALRLSVSLAIASPEGWRAAGQSTASTPARLLSPDPCAPCLYGYAIEDQRAIVTRQDLNGSYIIDAAGHVVDAPRWPAPVIGEGRLDQDGTCYAWAYDPPRLLVRDAGGDIVHDVRLPFTPTHVTAEHEGRLRFAALDGLWTWSAALRFERLLETPPLVAAWNGADGTLDLALLPPLGQPRARTARHLTWSPGGGLRSQEAPPLGPCWSRSTEAGWIAEALPDADVIRVSNRTGLAGWVIADNPRTVAWAGGSLIIVTAGGLVSFVPDVRRAFA
ncbi:MAG: 6-hydroxymethylpterin diphosphokinase MptE-like protein [Vicinamibacteraceae bacterium]